MKRLNRVVRQRIAYKITTKRKHHHAVAENLLNQNFNPVGKNQVWAGNITYLRTAKGWMYLAVVMDLYSRWVVGWHIDKRMTTDLIYQAKLKAISLRQPPKGLVFYSDRCCQYTSKRFRVLLSGFGIRASMGDVGACWGNAVVERFFDSLKHDWIRIFLANMSTYEAGRCRLYEVLQPGSAELSQWRNVSDQISEFSNQSVLFGLPRTPDITEGTSEQLTALSIIQSVSGFWS